MLDGRKRVLGARALLLGFVLFLLPCNAAAGVEWHDVQKLTLPAEVTDAASSVDGKLLFALTPGKILVYSLIEYKQVDTIPVETSFTRITASIEDKVILSGGSPSSIRILQVSPVYEIDISNRPVLGPADAPVTVVIFDDYQCPYCARLEEFMQQIRDRHPGKIKVVIKHFPLSSHPFATKAALAALASNNQGKFWEFHRDLLKNHNSLNDEKIKSIATGLGLDMKKYEADRNSAANRRIISEDVQNARQIGVNATPSVFLNGRRVENIAALPQLIESRIQAAK